VQEMSAIVAQRMPNTAFNVPGDGKPDRPFAEVATIVLTAQGADGETMQAVFSRDGFMTFIDHCRLAIADG
jgi:hypothetical protein